MTHFQLFYVSRLTQPLTTAQVRVLVGQAQLLNRRAGIGGLLAFTGNHFAQILEGRSDDVRALAHRISTDPRHHRYRVVRELNERPAPEFDTWGMQLMDSPALDADIGRLLARDERTDAGEAVLSRIRNEAQWRQGM